MNLKNLKAARAIMILAIVVSSLLGGIFGLRSLYKDVQDEFYNGSAEDVALYSDMKDAAEYGALIKKVLTVNGYVASDSDLVKALDLSYSQFESAEVNKPDSMKVSIEAFSKIQTAVDDLIAEADRMQLDEDTSKSYRQYKAGYEESLIFMSRSSFQETILEYNKTLGQFPASLFRRWARLEILQVFE